MGIKDGISMLSGKFLCSRDSYEEASVVIVGAPMDATCSFRPGTRFGPQGIRNVSIGIEEYSLYLDRSIEDACFFDSGDLNLPFGDVERALEIIGSAAEEVLKDEKVPLFIGGEHLISAPVVKKVYDKYGDDLIVLHFDAHADLRSDYLGCSNSHASAVRRMVDFMPGKNIFQFGIRSGTKEELTFAKENTNLYKFEVFEPLKRMVNNFENRPVYITLDIDVIDPAYANGTGTPEPGGISSRELIDSLGLLRTLNIVGVDLVEVSPPYDISDRTAVLAAKIIREILLMIG